jgi:hypothetical protein
MNINKIFTTLLITTLLTTKAKSQSEIFSLSFGGSYMFPKKELKESFGFLKGLEVSLSTPVSENSSIGMKYYSGYRWGEEPISTRLLEQKINADGFSINYNHELFDSKIIKPFYEFGLGYEKFKFGKNYGSKRVTEITKGETLNIGAGVKINLGKKKNTAIYLGAKKEFFLSNSKTNNNYSNIKLNAGMALRINSKNKQK